MAGSDRLDLGGTRQQIAVATLLLSANRVVTMDRLLEAIYGEDLPPTARSQAQISISSLRRLFASHSSGEIISTREHGYVINVDDGHLDSAQFQQLVTAARMARDSGKPDQAVASYRDALRLWRGPALDGMDSQLARVAASRLDEQRIASNEDRIELEIGLGRHHELVGELTELVQVFPLRERLRGLLMLALYRCDRTAEALRVYRECRSTMIDELGIEPGEKLQQLEHAILVADPALQPAAAHVMIRHTKRMVPNLLPADIADFTGRAEQIRQIHQHLARADDDDIRPTPVVVIVGKAGVGKTSVAVHASHGLAALFPDGQLFADLHGGTSHLIGPTQVLGRFLRALGVPGGQVPEGLDERAEVYRNLVADRKVLVVLDDAVSESQVSPLIPSSGAAAVMVTSRRRLTGLAGAIHIRLDVLDADKSLDLLARIAGAPRVQAEPAAATAVAEHCGRLPLALRIAGARLSARPHWSIQQLADRLADETRRLDELSHGEMGIRPSLLLTYQSVTEEARQLFRRLALIDAPAFSGWISAALLDQDVATAEDVLDDLISAQLIESAGDGSGLHSQYRFHDLIRVFARERLAEESATARKATLERALGALLHLAEKAHCRYFGGDFVRVRSEAPRWQLPERLTEQLVSDPLSWYDHERAALVAGVRQAARAGLVELSWGLACSTVALFESRIYLDDWQETHDIALEATRKTHNIRGQAAMLSSIGSLHITQQRLEPARRELTESIQLFEDAGDERGIALTTRHLAYLDRLNGRLHDATRYYEQALATFRSIGDQIGTAYVLHGLAQVELERHQPDRAKELLSEALLLSRATRCERIEAQVLYRLAEAHLATGELADAISSFELSLGLSSHIGDFVGKAYALQGIGVAKVRLAEFDQARQALRQAMEFAVAAGERLAQGRVLLGMGELALADRDPLHAVVFERQASQIFRDMGALLYEAQVLALLSDAYAALGDVEAANSASAQATALRTKLLGGPKLSRASSMPPRQAREPPTHGRRFTYLGRQGFRLIAADPHLAPGQHGAGHRAGRRVPPTPAGAVVRPGPAAGSHLVAGASHAWLARGAAEPARPGFLHPRRRRWRPLATQPANQPSHREPAWPRWRW